MSHESNLPQLLQTIDEAVAQFIEQGTKPVTASELGFDPRACYDGLRVTNDNDAIICPEHSVKSFEYYGGMEYVDRSHVRDVGQYRVYMLEDSDGDVCSRIGSHLPKDASWEPTVPFVVRDASGTVISEGLEMEEAIEFLAEYGSSATITPENSTKEFVVWDSVLQELSVSSEMPRELRLHAENCLHPESIDRI